MNQPDPPFPPSGLFLLDAVPVARLFERCLVWSRGGCRFRLGYVGIPAPRWRRIGRGVGRCWLKNSGIHHRSPREQKKGHHPVWVMAFESASSWLVWLHHPVDRTARSRLTRIVTALSSERDTSTHGVESTHQTTWATYIARQFTMSAG